MAPAIKNLFTRRIDEQEYKPVLEDLNNDYTDKPTDYIDEYRAAQRTARVLRLWLIIVSCVLAVVLGMLATGGVWYEKHAPVRIKSPVPTIPEKLVIFERDDRYAGPSNTETDEAWGTLNPPGDGFIIVNNSALYDLEPGKQSSSGEIYDISLFHELHCLNHIRTYAFTLKESIGKPNAMEIFSMLLEPDEDHVFHCFDYLRQALMCAGDMTVEWPRLEADGSRFAVDGWGIGHVCKDWDSIVGFMKENTVSEFWE